MTIDKLGLAKNAIGFVVGAGVSKIVHAVITNNISPVTLFDKVTVVSASLVLGSMAREATRKFINRQIDEIVAFVNETRDEMKTETDPA